MQPSLKFSPPPPPHSFQSIPALAAPAPGQEAMQLGAAESVPAASIGQAHLTVQTQIYNPQQAPTSASQLWMQQRYATRAEVQQLATRLELQQTQMQLLTTRLEEQVQGERAEDKRQADGLELQCIAVVRSAAVCTPSASSN